MMSQLQILVIKDPCGEWVAQCLEYDIAAQGKCIRSAMAAFESTLAAEILYHKEKGLEPLAGIGKAPQFYWDKFNECAQEIKQPKRILPKFKAPNLSFTLPKFREIRAA